MFVPIFGRGKSDGCTSQQAALVLSSLLFAWTLLPIEGKAQSSQQQAEPPPVAIKPSPTDFLPLDITPEGVLALQQSGTVPFELINTDRPQRPQEPDNHLRRIYYSSGISIRAAKNAVLQDRQQSARTTQNAAQASQRLTGTPLDWQQLGLSIDRETVPHKPLQVSPRALSEAIKDGIDLQIIDLRPPQAPPPSDTPAKQLKNPTGYGPFPSALAVMPHQLDAALPELSKKRWLILIDDGHGPALMLADQLYKQGFVLAGVLEGGYPAWVAATDR